ncbi:MAG: aminopeptidase N [Actinomycetaceae bacterium]|nr:aminopeptidase N [Actinomycetaceae bacterium]
MQTITRIEARHRARSVRVDSIDVELDVTGAPDPQARTFRSQSMVKFASREPSTFLDLIADRIDSVTVNGQPAQYTYSGSRIELTDLPTNSLLTVCVDARCLYSQTGEGLHRYRDPEDEGTYLYTQYEPTDARRVYACFDQPDIKPRWRFTIDAPTGWTVLSNQPHESVEVGGDRQRVRFAQTPPLSSFITAVIAGPYAKFEGGTWSRSNGEGPLTIPLRAFCRQSLAEYFDADEIFKATRSGLDFYHDHYSYDYPWGKYDQVFVPEYNLGAMENPGCVTFNEHFIHRDRPTRAQRQTRANVIYHEMCHMWFGDLVTPAWWDDLWLKESFADNQASWGLAETSEFTGEWATFASGRKEWAYEQDQLPTTHPIVADIPDIEAAKHNFDGITYAKGASVLKQLVAYVGREAFFAGARQYFRTHAFGATSLSDFLDALASASDCTDLDEWQRVWLHTAGPSRLTLIRRETEKGDTRIEIEQQCVDPLTGEDVMRPHTLIVGFYRLTDGKLVHNDSVQVTLDGPRTHVPIASDKARLADLIVVNDDDLTYAIVEMDDPQTQTALDYLGTLPGATTRAVVWSSLWNAVRDGRLDPRRYITAVLTHVHAESDDAVAEDLLRLASTGLRTFLASSQRSDIADTIISHAIDAISSVKQADRQRMWAHTAVRVLPMLHSDNDDFATFFTDLAEAASPLFDVGPTLAWKARTALAARGEITEADIDRFRSLDPSGEAHVASLRTLAAIPDRRLRRNLWDSVVETDLTNEKTSAILDGLATGSLTNTVGGFAGEFFTLVEDYWNSHTIGMGNRFVAGAYPLGIDASRPEDSHALRQMASSWLTSQDHAPTALRRLMIENRDELERRYRIQSRWLTD